MRFILIRSLRWLVVALIFLTVSKPAKSADRQFTFVVVHGAFGGGWDWKLVGNLLSAKGHTVYRPTLTGLGERAHLANRDINLTTHINDVLNVIRYEELTNVVLVGHSYAGMVVTGVMNAAPERISDVIFLDALIPNDGESVVSFGENVGNPIEAKDLRDAENRGFFQPGYMKFDRPPPSDMPQPFKTLTEAVRFDNPAAKRLPATYVFFISGTQNPEVLIEGDKDSLWLYSIWKRATERRWIIEKLASDHVAERSHPQQLAELLVRIAEHHSATGANMIRVAFPSEWNNGVRSDDPPIQIQTLAEKTWALRQSARTHYEAPFLYLFKGKTSALLWDTGAKAKIPLRETIDALIGNDFPLIVIHSHGHSDHTAGDVAFFGRPNTRIVDSSIIAVSEMSGIQSWPTSFGKTDLGERPLEIIPIPGHDKCDIALYDRRTGILLTGDTLYPGRLYVENQEEYRKSVQRLVDFCKVHPVSWILGNHIEMTKRAGVDFERRAAAHPNERSLELKVEHLVELNEALKALPEKLKYEVHNDFIIVPNN